jgi:hypothetical protein
MGDTNNNNINDNNPKLINSVLIASAMYPKDILDELEKEDPETLEVALAKIIENDYVIKNNNLCINKYGSGCCEYSQ